MLGLNDLFPNRGPKQNPNAAPYFEAPPRKFVAVEHPCVIYNVDKAIESFGRNPDFQRLLNDNDGRVSLPLWLRPENPLIKPIMSHTAASNNIVLQITVPKRTGRKRKRGSDEPFTGVATSSATGPSPKVCSVGRQDNPRTLLRKLQDNAGQYQAEAVGVIKDTHRYRGLADFQFSATQLPYLTKVADHILPMQVSKLRQLRIDPALQTGKGQEIIPPPHFTDKVIPFNYFYEQNPYVREQGKDEFGNPIVVNVQGRLTLTFGHYIQYDHFPVPTGPTKKMSDSRQVPKDLLDRMKAALEERPIWTRRALINRVSPYYSENAMKIAIQLVGYQFKGGPWRDAVIKYGIDPRTDPKYRVYQTLAFKLNEFPPDCAVSNGVVRRMGKEEARTSHIWDGEAYYTNGKFWQICDVTDQDLLKMIEEAPLRDQCDITADGWWYSGTWARIKAFMKAKMIAIKAGRLGSEGDDPKRKGYIYNSVLLQKLSIVPHVDPPNGRNAVNVLTLLYGMEDVAGLEGIRYRYRPRHDYKDPLTAMGFRGDSWRRPRPQSYESAGGPEQAEQQEPVARSTERDGARASGGTGPTSPDDAWAHILDSDLSGDEDEDEEEEEEEEDGEAVAEDDGDGRTAVQNSLNVACEEDDGDDMSEDDDGDSGPDIVEDEVTNTPGHDDDIESDYE
ncbi:RNA polymerase III transcription factor IIIC subunit-domain-containing protein [Xylariales sp. PMI_506]|nr:RNA polymerase III transcription factor IIIC subunit-domain-containing protein [Xylariales sp. PMI_506]